LGALFSGKPVFRHLVQTEAYPPQFLLKEAGFF